MVSGLASPIEQTKNPSDQRILRYHNRDVNAAKNILNQGINILSGCGMQSDTKQKQGEALPLGESVTLEAQPISFAVGG